mmetsp:Transcript_5977/g.6576  ORF Transcript_5977/g.6576 Transcript_5977/m.6576 type:complete len:476 (+) Transcript_5977:185-1612(+)
MDLYYYKVCIIFLFLESIHRVDSYSVFRNMFSQNLIVNPTTMYARKTSPREKSQPNQKNDSPNKNKGNSTPSPKSSLKSEVLAATKEFAKPEFSWKDVLAGSSSSTGVMLASNEEVGTKRPILPERSKGQSPLRQKTRISSPVNPFPVQPPRQRTTQQIQSIRLKNEQVLQKVQNLSKNIQLMVLLCGIPGSGKSTIAKRIVETSQTYYDSSYEDELSTSDTHPSNMTESKKRLHFLREWASYTQDQFKSRKVMERYCNDAILKGYNLIIDRCNFDAEQRSHWIRMIYDYYATHSEQQQYYYSYGRSYYPYGDISPPPSKTSYSSLDRHSHGTTSHLSTYKPQYSYTSNPYAYEYYQTMVPSEAVVETSAYPSTNSFSQPPEKPFYVLCIMVPNFDNYDVCVQRATKRGDSDGLHDADTDWRKVCASMVQNLQYPSTDEAIDGIYHCNDEKELDELMDTLLFGLSEPSTMPIPQR